jgi:hypothetical protein
MLQGYFNGVPYNGQTYNPNLSTNWHDAMLKLDAMAAPDLVIFLRMENLQPGHKLMDQ